MGQDSCPDVSGTESVCYENSVRELQEPCPKLARIITLLDYSLEKATELDYGAVLFEGNIDFYGKSGFDYARIFGIRYHDLPEDADDSFFLCKELIPGYLEGITGVYQTPQGYYVDDSDVETFDKDFPPKKKEKLPGQNNE